MGVLDEILNRRGAAVGAAVDRFKQGVQQRADARQQQSLANNREQNSANPMLRGNRPQQQVGGTTASQSAAIPQQTQQVPQVTDLAGLGEALERTRRAVDEARESEEDKQARERREKRQMLMAKLGDGLSAFHNAYSYMRGIKPMTSGSMSAQTEARIKALGLERDKKYNDALDNYLKVLDIQRKEDYYNSLAESRRAEQESRDAARQSRERREQEKLDLQKQLREDKQHTDAEKSAFWDAYWYYRDTLGYDDIKARSEASKYSYNVREQANANDQAESEAKVKKLQSDAHKSDAAANASNARADKTRAGGSSSGGTVTTTSDKTVYDKNGNVKGRTVTTTTKKKGGSGKSSNKNNSGKKRTGVNWNK